MKSVEGLPEYFEEAVEISRKRSLAADLMKEDKTLITVMTAFYAFKRWREEEDISALLLLM